jgi:UDP-N-acetylglucosamine 4-epimerase
MQCLVTGGAGFIGSHLLQRLLADDHHVRILDDFSTGHRHNLSLSMQQQCSPDRLDIIEGDIRNTKTCLLASRDCSHVFHLAAQTSVPASIDNPRLTFDINVSGFENILDACIVNKVQQFVYSSSSAVYGRNPNRAKEDQNCRPDTPYAKSKLENEIYADTIIKTEHINCIGLRYFNVFGIRKEGGYSSYSPVISNWIEAIVNNKPVHIFGDGSNTRDFIPVRDAINANMLAINCSIRNTVVNIASGHSISLIELYKLMVETYRDLGLEYSRKAVHSSPRKGDIVDSIADIGKARRLLEYEPADNLQACIREMFKFRLN